MLPELRAANAGDIAVLVVAVVIMTVSHVGMRYSYYTAEKSKKTN